MRSRLKLAATAATLIVALGACSKNEPAHGADATSPPPAAEQVALQTVDIPASTLTIQIPAEMKIAQGSTPGMKAYTLDDNQAVMLTGVDVSSQLAGVDAKTKEGASAGMVAGAEGSLKSQFPDMTVLSKGEVKAGDITLQKLEANVTAPGILGQKAHAIFALGLVDDRMVIVGTLARADEKEANLKLFEQVIGSVKKKG